MTYTIFLHLRALPAWLALPRTERDAVAAEALLLADFDRAGSLRFFDAEAFTARCSDIAMVTTADLQAFYFAIERLRDTALFATPYFELVSILPCIENGFQHFAAEAAA